MREIKFRAWDEGAKAMRDVVDVAFLDGNALAGFRVQSGEIRTLNKPHLMQFTGLKDKNGREIYGGDILSFPDTESEYVDVGIGNVKVAEFPLNAFFPVEFKECEFGMTVEGTEHGINGWISLRAFNEDYYKMFECEVIGNIYENPELLK